MEPGSLTDGFWTVSFMVLVLAIQVGTAVGFVWIVVHFATRKRTGETDERLRNLEQRIASIEHSRETDSHAE